MTSSVADCWSAIVVAICSIPILFGLWMFSSVLRHKSFLKILFQFWDTRFFVPCVAFGSPWPPGRHCELKNCKKTMFFKQFDFAVPARNFCCYTQYFRPLAARTLLGAGRLGGPAEPNGRIWIEPGPRPRRRQGQQFLFRLLISKTSFQNGLVKFCFRHCVSKLVIQNYLSNIGQTVLGLKATFFYLRVFHSILKGTPKRC